VQKPIPDGQFANAGPMICQILTANARIMGINHHDLVKNLKSIVRPGVWHGAANAEVGFHHEGTKNTKLGP
jgi:hypothetical protein